MKRREGESWVIFYDASREVSAKGAYPLLGNNRNIKARCMYHILNMRKLIPVRAFLFLACLGATAEQNLHLGTVSCCENNVILFSSSTEFRYNPIMDGNNQVGNIHFDPHWRFLQVGRRAKILFCEY